MLCIDSVNGETNWVSQVRNVLESTGFGHVWLNHGVENDKLFLFNFKQRLRDNFGQKTHLELQNTSRGKFYLLYNDFFMTGVKYLNIVQTTQHIGWH